MSKLMLWVCAFLICVLLYSMLTSTFHIQLRGNLFCYSLDTSPKSLHLNAFLINPAISLCIHISLALGHFLKFRPFLLVCMFSVLPSFLFSCLFNQLFTLHQSELYRASICLFSFILKQKYVPSHPS